ncbi:MAG TPA: nuclease-related domain-containing protein [Symbiobacteriaceae bacterium]|nr:nuclease-related domain-containing protein [Symbiobacteriaceae bacterium]
MNPVARQKAEMEDGHGLRRLAGLLKQLADGVTVILQPKLGWMMDADCCVIGPGRVLVISAVHWKGKIIGGPNEEWLGASGTDLGRPDRRAAYFAKRLDYSGQAAGMTVESVVVFTDGPVDFHGPPLVATLVYWDEALSVLAGAFPPDRGPVDVSELVRLLGGK